jgi:hypothetical protein
MEEKKFQKNVLGEELESCSNEPLTGWFRDGCCNTNEVDRGVHTVCAKVTKKFLEWAQTVCTPRSTSFVLQHPSLNQPVKGSLEQLSSSSPSTFF